MMIGLAGKKNRVCIIFPGNIFTTPFLKRYTDILKQMHIDYDVVYWDAVGIKETTDAADSYVLSYKMAPLDHPICKLLGYYRFYKLASEVIKSNHYGRIICLTSIPAVMLCNELIKQYVGKYIVDIRDYYKEGNHFYYKREKKAIEHSFFSVISSPGYKEFLPDHQYIIAHNITWIKREQLNSLLTIPKKKKETIKLAYIGNMRFFELDKQLLFFFANDNRFHVSFIGKGYSVLQQYCNENGIANVSIIDWFPPDKTVEYFKETDIVLNLYGNGSPIVDYALSNKLYYAAQLRKPILVCPYTYMEKITKQYGFGFVFDQSDPMIKDKLFQYYNSIDWKLFEDNCDRFLDDVRQDDELFVKNIHEFLNI